MTTGNDAIVYVISLISISPLTSLEGEGKGGARGIHSSAGRGRRTKRRKKKENKGIYILKRESKDHRYLF